MKMEAKERKRCKNKQVWYQDGGGWWYDEM